jgi:hypothetical protein
MPKPGTERPTTKLSSIKLVSSIKLLWIAGIVVWCPMVLLLLHRQYQAQTFVQASLAGARLTYVALIGSFWSLAGSLWLAKLRKTSKS